MPQMVIRVASVVGVICRLVKPRVLVTGFGPFPGVPENPSEAAVTALQRRADAGGLDDIQLTTEILAVDFALIVSRLCALLDEIRPDVVIATGVDAGARAITVERVAINLVDARIPDSTGAQPIDRPVIAGEPDGLFVTLPVKAVRAAIQATGSPAELSLSAGTYGCNAAMYAVLAAAPDGTRGGFLHVPPADVIGTDEVADALVAAIRATLAHDTDLVEAGGELA